ncbi:MAG TPA: hypothetical protein VE987_19660 [Polyangiaceae bacterium]|nr:hypothetical protein [Polyangiaceae bacterium]
MLVPSIAFAWWLVAMPSPAPSPRAAAEAALPAVQAATEAQPQPQDGVDDATDDPTPDDDATDDDHAGRRVPVKVVTPEIVRAAKAYLKELSPLPLGSERSATIGGRRYFFVLERHYHPPGFVGGPRGWHKGITVYELR